MTVVGHDHATIAVVPRRRGSATGNLLSVVGDDLAAQHADVLDLDLDDVAGG